MYESAVDKFGGGGAQNEYSARSAKPSFGDSMHQSKPLQVAVADESENCDYYYCTRDKITLIFRFSV